MSDRKPLVFDDFAAHEEPVSVGGKPYILRELSEGGHAVFANASSKGSRIVNGEMHIATDGSGDLPALLVSLCLFEKYDSGGTTKERPVPQNVVKQWRHEIVQAIFERAKEISHVGGVETEDSLTKTIADAERRLAKLRAARSNGHASVEEEFAKNLPAATTASSA